MTEEEEQINLSNVLGSLKIAATSIAQSLPQERNAKENPFLIVNAGGHHNNSEVNATADNNGSDLFGTQSHSHQCADCTRTNHCSSSQKTFEHSMLNQKQFKQRKKNQFKLLKQPTLLLIEKCLNHGLVNKNENHHFGSSVGNSSIKSTVHHDCLDDESLLSTSSPPTISSSSNSTNGGDEKSNDSCESSPKIPSPSTDWSLGNSNLVDFKSLITECEGLSLSLEKRSTTSSTLPCSIHKSKNFRTHHKKWSKERGGGNGKSTLIPRPIYSQKHGEHMSRRSYIARRPSGTSNNNSKGPTAASLAASGGSSTCSQQALYLPNCDVTIDELASYFETFVHIPKKMSTMAEMMYI